MTTLLLALLVTVGTDGSHDGAVATAGRASASAQERKTVPSDSVEIEARGCIKGRVFTGTGQPEEERTSKSPDVTGKSFRMTGEKDVMDLVKKYNGQYVEVLGIVRKAALDDQGIGMRVGRGRVVIGAPGVDPTRMNSPASAPSVPAMDVIAVRVLTDRCPLQ